ncbi:MAG TPA: nickel-responsive transcriptional regulator NikR [Euryarchaeota archaeon]|nr:MAG: nickel-responsive transcriptional regulator NikR [Thermoplasmatales archaeon ex4484_6]HHD15797.1 nickel-responsive transcriptional regulator NikR [Euryarchaeota archaeon]
MAVSRVGVSFEPELLERFDELIGEKGYQSRSEAIRDLVRKAIMERDVEGREGEVVGTLTYIYDHHQCDVNNKLLDLQHSHYHDILFTTHVHMDHDMCLEVLIVKGEAEDVRKLSDNIRAIKGVKHGELVITRTPP